MAGGNPFLVTAAVGFIAMSGAAVLNGVVMLNYGSSWPAYPDARDIVGNKTFVPAFTTA